ncbi:MAG: OmpH family outer membrane protein [Planctomycetota bacterium]
MKMGQVLTLLAAVAVVGLGWSAVRGQAGQAAPTAVGVVDVEEVFQGLKAQTEFEAEIQRKREELGVEAQSRQAAAKGMQDDLDMLTAGTPAYEVKQTELERAAIDLDVWQRYEQLKLARQAKSQIEKLYRDVIDAVDRIATESGYDVVLLEQDRDAIDAENIQQLLGQIGTRKVLFAADRIDLTDTVIRRMNNEFDAAR